MKKMFSKKTTYIPLLIAAGIFFITKRIMQYINSTHPAVDHFRDNQPSYNIGYFIGVNGSIILGFILFIGAYLLARKSPALK